MVKINIGGVPSILIILGILVLKMNYLNLRELTLIGKLIRVELVICVKI